MSEPKLFRPADLEALRCIATSRIEHIRNAEYDDADNALKRLGAHTRQLLDHIESQAKRIETQDAALDNMAHKLTDAETELTRLREVVEKRECEVCALADMVDGRFGLGWWTSEAKAIRNVTRAAQAEAEKLTRDVTPTPSG